MGRSLYVVTGIYGSWSVHKTSLRLSMIWIPPIITAWLFAMSAICGQRTTALMDPMWANLTRLSIASVFLAVIAGTTDGWHLQNTALPWFALSGLVGFGLGDIGLFLAYAFIGARLTLLIGLCLAPIFALLGEWVIFGQRIHWPEFIAVLVTLLGVGIAITGKRPTNRAQPHRYGLGIALAICAGLGQGLGAVLSRLAESHASSPVGPFAQAFQRCTAGWLALLIATLIWARIKPTAEANLKHTSWKTVWPWMLGAVLFGPVIGVSCFQWALVLVGNSGLVQAIVSTTPIALIPLAWVFDRDVPTGRSVLGSIIAVAGVAGICLWPQILERLASS